MARCNTLTLPSHIERTADAFATTLQDFPQVRKFLLQDLPIQKQPGTECTVLCRRRHLVVHGLLVPLVKTLQAELGEERANAIVRKALSDLYRKFGEKWWQAQGRRNLGETMASAFDRFAAGDALDYEVLRKTPNGFDINVTGCRYAEFYKKIGVPELGFLLICSADFRMAEGFGPDVQLARTQTIMQGASHCDFRYTRINPKDGSDAT